MRPLEECLLYGILDLGYCPEERLLAVAEAMANGGVDIIQLRAKAFRPDAIARMGRLLAPLMREREIPFVINDHPELVDIIGADGAHVGQDDLAVAQARSLMPDQKILGLSTHSIGQAVEAAACAPDYIGFGPLFATPTKPDYQAIGCAGIADAHRLVSLPIFCIGGIKRENVDAVIDAGALRVVIVSGILQADDIPAYCRDVKDRLVARYARHLAGKHEPLQS